MNVDAQEWKLRGACSISPTATTEEARRMLALFFPVNHISAEAEALCAACPVRQECVDYALDNGIVHGQWGERAKEREKIRRERSVRVASENDAA